MNIVREQNKANCFIVTKSPINKDFTMQNGKQNEKIKSNLFAVCFSFCRPFYSFCRMLIEFLCFVKNNLTTPSCCNGASADFGNIYTKQSALTNKKGRKPEKESKQCISNSLELHIKCL